MKAVLVLVVIVALVGGAYVAMGPGLEKVGDSLGLLGGLLLVAFLCWVPIALLVNSGASDF